jgi:hypothetical protein
MNGLIAVTDHEWFEFLRLSHGGAALGVAMGFHPEEVATCHALACSSLHGSRL